MRNYLDLLDRTLTHGFNLQTRNGDRITTYGAQLRFDLTKGFPLVTTRNIPWKNPSAEICWFLRGDTNTKFLHQHNVHIWDANADDNGYVGKIYGYQWRFGFGVDQIERAVNMLKKTPKSTRNVVTAWNPVDMDEMALPPCHKDFQLHSDGRNLTLQFSMRSTDLAIGLPCNIAGYALLCHLFAKIVGQRPVEVIADLGNVHIYATHVDGTVQQLQRDPLPPPHVQVDDSEIDRTLFNLSPRIFGLMDYQCHPAIKFEMIA